MLPTETIRANTNIHAYRFVVGANFCDVLIRYTARSVSKLGIVRHHVLFAGVVVWCVFSSSVYLCLFAPTASRDVNFFKHHDMGLVIVIVSCRVHAMHPQHISAHFTSVALLVVSHLVQIWVIVIPCLFTSCQHSPSAAFSTSVRIDLRSDSGVDVLSRQTETWEHHQQRKLGSASCNGWKEGRGRREYRRPGREDRSL